MESYLCVILLYNAFDYLWQTCLSLCADQVRQQLVDLIQQQLGSQATVELQVAGGRKLLQVSQLFLL